MLETVSTYIPLSHTRLQMVSKIQGEEMTLNIIQRVGE
jgi:hypothetical protein